MDATAAVSGLSLTWRDAVLRGGWFGVRWRGKMTGRLEKADVSCTTFGGRRVYYFLRVELHDGNNGCWIQVKVSFVLSWHRFGIPIPRRRKEIRGDQAFLPS
jgi:hypothetical protein